VRDEVSKETDEKDEKLAIEDKKNRGHNLLSVSDSLTRPRPLSFASSLLLSFLAQRANGPCCPLDDNEHGFVVRASSRRRPEQQQLRAPRRRRRRIRRHRRRDSLRGYGRSGAAQVPRAEGRN